MRRVLGILAVLFLSVFGAARAQAGVDVSVDIPAQRMTVTTSAGEVYEWKISSGRKGFRSPNGVYRPTRLEKNWYSRKYGGAMPYAVFFRGGYAIHGTTSVGALGRPASHGCIRLHPANAAKFFALVKTYGAGQTRIALHGAAPDNLSRFAKASAPAKAKLAKASVRKAKIDRAEIAGLDIMRLDGSKAHVTGNKTTKTKLAKVNGSKAKIAKAKARNSQGWEAARGQILLRPALPASAFGYQPYYPAGYGYGYGYYSYGRR